MTTLALAGASLLVSSYSVRQRREADYAQAMNYAEAGINYEIRYVSTNQAAHQASAPYSGSIPGFPGAFKVWATSTSGSVWTAPNPMYVYSQGTYNGITRTVRVTCARQSVFNTCSIFGNNGVTFSGPSGSCGGDCWSNGNVSCGSRSSTSTCSGKIHLCGSNSGGCSGSNVCQDPNPVSYPSCDDICSSTISGGWSSLSSSSALSASYGKMRQFSSTSNSTVSRANTKAANLSYSGGTGYGIALVGQAATLTASQCKSLNQNTLILPPGDYYFNSCQLDSNCKVICDTAGLCGSGAGQVRIWINGSSSWWQGTQDTLCNVSCTSTDPSLFRCYYNRSYGNLNVCGNCDIHGCVYCCRKDHTCSLCLGDGDQNGNNSTGKVKIDGACCSDNTTICSSGVSFPTVPIDNQSDYGLWYGYQNQWVELAPTKGVLFSDGTNR